MASLPTIFLFLAGFALGSVLGSFAGVLAYRLPRGEDILVKPSYCPACARKLTSRDLIPVYSWLIFKGRCRTCHTSIGIEALAFDLGMGLCGAILAAIFGLTLQAALLLLSATLFASLFVIMARRGRYPLWLPIMAVTLILAANAIDFL